MDKRILDIAEDMIQYTNTNIESSELVPYFTSSDLTLVNEFYINKTLHKVWYTDEETAVVDRRFAILTDSITLCPQLRNSITDKITGEVIEGISVMELIDTHVIHPFLLFVNGKFVKWSEIFLYQDRRYQVLVVDSKVDYTIGVGTTDLQVLQLPLPLLSYTEEWEMKDDETLIFAFNDDGFIDITGHTRIYMKDQSIIGYIQLLLPGGNIEDDDIQVPDECQLYPSNIIVFKDNMIYPNPKKIEISPYNTMTIDDGETIGLEYKMFYDKRVNLPYNNVSQIINHNYLKNEYLNTNPNPDWLTALHKGFDFDPPLRLIDEYDKDLEKFSEYMLDYNYQEVISRIRSENVHMYSGYIGDYADKSNVLLMHPKEFTHSNIGYMLFVNGVLSNTIATEYTYGIRVNFSRYTDDSVYEFISFQNFIDDSETILIDSSDPDKKYFNGFWQYGDNYDLFSCYHPDEIFHMYENHIQELDLLGLLYKIDPSKYIVSEDGITFSEFYTSKDRAPIIRVPRTKFAYNRFVVEKTEDFNVHLNDAFKYCNDEYKYIVFVNGYKIESNLYRVIVPSPEVPFTDQAIYFSVLLKKGDIVEVFYTPMSLIDEVHIEDLEHSTESGTGVDQLGFITGPSNYSVPISKELQFFFVNGIKIPKDYLMDISYNMVRIIVNMKSIENLCLIGFDNELIDFFESLELHPSRLDDVYDAHDKQGIGILTNTYTAVTNVSPIREKEITDHALINEIVRYYYGPVNRGIPFTYKYDDTVYAEVDADGNIVIDVMDATKNVNINLKK